MYDAGGQEVQDGLYIKLVQADLYSKTVIKRQTEKPHEEQGEEGSKEGSRKRSGGGGAGVQLSGRVFS